MLLVCLSAALAQQPAPSPHPSPPPTPDEDQAQARLLFENGERLYDEGRYEQAIVAFREAYDLSRRPALLYNMANAYERLGRLEEAVDALNAFRIHASPDQQDVLMARVAAIEERIARQREDAATVLEPLDPAPRPQRRSPAPWVLASAGAVLAVGGGSVAGGTWLSSRQQRDPEQWAATRPLNNAAFGSAMAGLTIGLTGIVWGISRGP